MPTADVQSDLYPTACACWVRSWLALIGSCAPGLCVRSAFYGVARLTAIGVLEFTVASTGTHLQRRALASDRLTVVCQRLSYGRRSLIFWAGTPPYTPHGSRSRVATDPSPSTAPSPILTPGETTARAHTHAYAPNDAEYASNGNAGSFISVSPHKCRPLARRSHATRSTSAPDCKSPRHLPLPPYLHKQDSTGAQTFDPG